MQLRRGLHASLRWRLLIATSPDHFAKGAIFESSLVRTERTVWGCSARAFAISATVAPRERRSSSGLPRPPPAGRSAGQVWLYALDSVSPLLAVGSTLTL